MIMASIETRARREMNSSRRKNESLVFGALLGFYSYWFSSASLESSTFKILNYPQRTNILKKIQRTSTQFVHDSKTFVINTFRRITSRGHELATKCDDLKVNEISPGQDKVLHSVTESSEPEVDKLTETFFSDKEQQVPSGVQNRMKSYDGDAVPMNSVIFLSSLNCNSIA